MRTDTNTTDSAKRMSDIDAWYEIERISYSFDSLERMDKREIQVSGADIGYINGVYVLVELFDGYRRYSKGVIVGGEPRLSSIEAKKGVGSVYWELGGFFIGVYSIRDAAASTDIANAYPPIGQWKLKQGTALNNKTATVSYLS